MLTRQDSREEFGRVWPSGTVIAVQYGGVLPVGDSSVSGTHLYVISAAGMIILQAVCMRSGRGMTMRTKSLAALAAGLLGCASPVHADDWTGVYIGIGGGMGAANHDLSFENGPGFPSLPAFGAELSGLGGDGGFFSLGVGLDYQVNSRFVVGGFFDYDWTISTRRSTRRLSFGLGRRSARVPTSKSKTCGRSAGAWAISSRRARCSS